VRAQATYAIELEASGSRVKFGFGVPVLLGPARLLRHLVCLAAPVVERSFRKDLQRLKERLEAARGAKLRRRGPLRYHLTLAYTAAVMNSRLCPVAHFGHYSRLAWRGSRA